MSKASKEYFRRYYHQRKLDYQKLLESHCNKCGSTEDLQFDHIDPKTKSFTISKLMNYSKEKVLEELRKCQLLCKSCHLHKSQEEGSLSKKPHNKGKWKHGTTTSYMAKGCRCKVCKDFYSEYKRNRRREFGWK